MLAGSSGSSGSSVQNLQPENLHPEVKDRNGAALNAARGLKLPGNKHREESSESEPSTPKQNPQNRKEIPPAISRPGETLRRKLISLGCKVNRALNILISQELPNNAQQELPDNAQQEFPDIAQDKIGEYLLGGKIQGLRGDSTPFDNHTPAKEIQLMNIARKITIGVI